MTDTGKFGQGACAVEADDEVITALDFQTVADGVTCNPAAPDGGLFIIGHQEEHGDAFASYPGNDRVPASIPNREADRSPGDMLFCERNDADVFAASATPFGDPTMLFMDY